MSSEQVNGRLSMVKETTPGRVSVKKCHSNGCEGRLTVKFPLGGCEGWSVSERNNSIPLKQTTGCVEGTYTNIETSKHKISTRRKRYSHL